MRIICNALEDGWTVKKLPTSNKTFEFTKNNFNCTKDNVKNNENKNYHNHLQLLSDIKNNKINKLKKSISNSV
jgi:hypothetical protein